MTEKLENGTAVAEAQDPPAAPPPQAVARVPVRLGIIPQTPEEAWRLAQMMAPSELVPKGFRNKPADILVAIQMGVEIGFPPMQALQSIAVINGRPSVWGDGFLALIMSSSLYKDHDEYFEVDGARRDVLTADDLKHDTTVAICTFWRRGKPQPITRSFSIGQARKAGLLGKEGPWQGYPDRMLRMRARSWAGRDAFPDLLRGIRTAEEAMDTPDQDAIDVAPAPTPIQPQRASEAARFAPSAAASSATTTDSDASSRNADTERRVPAPSAARPADGATEPSTTTLRGLLIRSTTFVRPKLAGTEPHYEIVAETATGSMRTFITRNEDVYKDAAALEGTDQRINATVRPQGSGSNVTLHLEAIENYDAPAGTLFESQQA